VSGDPTRPMGGWPPEGGGQPGWPEQPPAHTPDRRGPANRNEPAYRPRRRRLPLIAGITVVVIIILLVVGDRVAVKIAENQIADKIQSSGFPAKPSVNIEGFPFLTQVLAHDLRTVKITASNVQEGPLEISSIDATATGVHLNSGFNGATVDQINGTALITFASLANASGASGGVTLSADGPNQVKVTAGIGPISDTAVARVTRTGPSKISVQVVDGGGIPTSVLGSLADFTVNVPKLPAGLQITNVSVTQQGLSITASAQHTTLSQ
jgi:LmeA-like phospholipid-binding